MDRRMVEAVRYCQRRGLDPYEMVWGYRDRIRFSQVRYLWYIGAR